MKLWVRTGLHIACALLGSVRIAQAGDDLAVSLQVNGVTAQAAYEKVFKDLSLTPSEGDNPIWGKYAFTPVTLNLSNQPFWEVMTQLDRATGVTFGGVQGDTALLFMDHGRSARRPAVISGPLRISATSAQSQQSIVLSKSRQKTESCTIMIAVQADPRSHAVILEPEQPAAQAQPASPRPGQQPQRKAVPVAFTTNGASFEVPFQRADAMQTVADIPVKFTLWYAAQTAPLTITLAGGGTHAGKNFGKFSGQAIFHTSPQGVGAVDLTLTNTGLDPTEWRRLSTALDAAGPTLQDAAGHHFRRGGGSGNVTGSTITRSIQFSADPKKKLGEPLTLTWNIPVTLESQPIAVVLKQLPLP